MCVGSKMERGCVWAVYYKGDHEGCKMCAKKTPMTLVGNTKKTFGTKVGTQVAQVGAR